MKTNFQQLKEKLLHCLFNDDYHNEIGEDNIRFKKETNTIEITQTKYNKIEWQPDMMIDFESINELSKIIGHTKISYHINCYPLKGDRIYLNIRIILYDADKILNEEIPDDIIPQKITCGLSNENKLEVLDVLDSLNVLEDNDLEFDTFLKGFDEKSRN